MAAGGHGRRQYGRSVQCQRRDVGGLSITDAKCSETKKKGGKEEKPSYERKMSPGLPLKAQQSPGHPYPQLFTFGRPTAGCRPHLKNEGSPVPQGTPRE